MGKVKSIAKFKWYGKEAKDIAKNAAAKALIFCGAHLQGESANQAPIDTGDLRRNCNVSPLKIQRKNIQVTVGYNLPYARRQHEELHFRHPKGGKAKFLEDPFNENLDKYDAYIQKTIKDALEKG
ncbi:HK97 gp10 family phage protein [Caloramator sp. CAR-1]|uniref:HK97 gp10 family phage protein n=1 Tax=Caloramator sp. CAR-1 TaxID=3062777 RepID=UPI0026E1267A|nr:HK97 gp10 family phage protein [Caloramator sp. CAR-1]MDO6355115.1 HK97 gp10 family phage protein [Caloramator sp. CAR-1]